MASALCRRALLRACGGKPPRFLSPSRRFSGEAPRRFAALWGNGDYGRLGLGGLESRWKPTVCPFFDDDPPVSIACGGAHTLFLTGTCLSLKFVLLCFLRERKAAISIKRRILNSSSVIRFSIFFFPFRRNLDAEFEIRKIK